MTGCDMPKFKETPSQTAGPYQHIGLIPQAYEIFGLHDETLGVKPNSGEFTISGQIFDGACEPAKDAI